LAESAATRAPCRGESVTTNAVHELPSPHLHIQEWLNSDNNNDYFT